MVHPYPGQTLLVKLLAVRLGQQYRVAHQATLKSPFWYLGRNIATDGLLHASARKRDPGSPCSPLRRAQVSNSVVCGSGCMAERVRECELQVCHVIPRWYIADNQDELRKVRAVWLSNGT